MPTAAQVGGAAGHHGAARPRRNVNDRVAAGDRGEDRDDHSQITTGVGGRLHGTTAADVGAEAAGVVSDVPQSTFIGAPIAPADWRHCYRRNGARTPYCHPWRTLDRCGSVLDWDITATSAMSGQTLHLVVYRRGRAGDRDRCCGRKLSMRPLFSRRQLQRRRRSSLTGVVGVLFPSTLAGNDHAVRLPRSDDGIRLLRRVRQLRVFVRCRHRVRRQRRRSRPTRSARRLQQPCWAPPTATAGLPADLLEGFVMPTTTSSYDGLTLEWRIVDNGDGTGTRTTYHADGTVDTVEQLTGLPIPPPPEPDPLTDPQAQLAAQQALIDELLAALGGGGNG